MAILVAPTQWAITGDSVAGLSSIPSFHSTANFTENESPLKTADGALESSAAHLSPTRRMEVITDSGYSVTILPPFLYSKRPPTFVRARLSKNFPDVTVPFTERHPSSR